MNYGTATQGIIRTVGFAPVEHGYRVLVARAGWDERFGPRCSVYPMAGWATAAQFLADASGIPISDEMPGTRRVIPTWYGEAGQGLIGPGLTVQQYALIRVVQPYEAHDLAAFAAEAARIEVEACVITVRPRTAAQRPQAVR